MKPEHSLVALPRPHCGYRASFTDPALSASEIVGVSAAAVLRPFFNYHTLDGLLSSGLFFPSKDVRFNALMTFQSQQAVSAPSKTPKPGLPSYWTFGLNRCTVQTPLKARTRRSPKRCRADFSQVIFAATSPCGCPLYYSDWTVAETHFKFALNATVISNIGRAECSCWDYPLLRITQPSNIL